MDKNFLKENNLLEAQKRFKMIVEYSNMLPSMDEAGEDTNAMPQGGVDMGGAPTDPSMGGEMPQGDPNMGGMGQYPNMGGTMPQGDDMGAQDTNMGGEGVQGFNPQMGNDSTMGGDMPMDGNTDTLGEDDEVIDVDDLTNSQEHTEHKVDKLTHKLNKFMSLVDELEQTIQANNEHIEQLRQDFEKRNPTQVEKLSMRSAKGEPFNENPQEFWEKKEAEGDYSREDDNNGIGDERYKITKNDVDNINDWKSIYDSISKDGFKQNLRDILGM